MGIFDTVDVTCPRCGNRTTVSSKTPDSADNHYEIETCPPEVLMGIGQYRPFRCDSCKRWFDAEFEIAVRLVPTEAPKPS